MGICPSFYHSRRSQPFPQNDSAGVIFANYAIINDFFLRRNAGIGVNVPILRPI
jgi:hypothetical protein